MIFILEQGSNWNMNQAEACHYQNCRRRFHDAIPTEMLGMQTLTDLTIANQAVPCSAAHDGLRHDPQEIPNA